MTTTGEPAPVAKLQVRQDQLHWQQVDDEFIVLDEVSSSYLSFRGSAAVLFPLLVVGTTLAELSGELRRSYGIDESQANADVAAFLGSLERHQLLVR